MITLRPFTKQDMPSLSSWISSEEELVQFAGPVFHYPLSWEQLEEHIAHAQRQFYTAICPDTTEIIGVGEVVWNAENRPRLCRIMVSPAARGKGYGKQIVQSLLELAFARTEVRQVSLNVYDFNVSAIKCYEQCGFTPAADQRPAERAGWKNWQALHMTIGREIFQKRVGKAAKTRKPL